MANNSGVLQRVSTTVALCFTAGTHANSAFAVSVILLVAFPCFAQDQPRPLLLAGANSGAQVSGQTATVTIPAGTRLALVLTSRLSSKTVHRGDTIYAQMTAPVAVGNSVAIPAGTFVQGQVNELTRHDSRAEIQLEAVSLLFSGGYVANVAGPMKIETDEGTAWRVATRGGIAAAVAAPAIGAAGGALVGHAANSSSGSTVNGLTINPDRMQSTAIGAMAGLAAGGVVGLLMFAHSRQFFVDVGSPMELDLPHSVALAQDRVTDAVRQSLSQPTSVTPVANRPPPPTPTPSPTHTCYTPGTPGTPQIVIPGTPPIGGSPGTPDIVIPGTPPIPGTPYPCD